MNDLRYFYLNFLVSLISTATLSYSCEHPLSLQDIERNIDNGRNGRPAEVVVFFEQEGKRIERKIGTENYNKLAEVWDINSIKHCLDACGAGNAYYSSRRVRARLSKDEIVTLVEENGTEKEISLTVPEFVVCTTLFSEKQGRAK